MFTASPMLHRWFVPTPASTLAQLEVLALNASCHRASPGNAQDGEVVKFDGS